MMVSVYVFECVGYMFLSFICLVQIHTSKLFFVFQTSEVASCRARHLHERWSSWRNPVHEGLLPVIAFHPSERHRHGVSFRRRIVEIRQGGGKIHECRERVEGRHNSQRKSTHRHLRSNRRLLPYSTTKMDFG